MEKELTQMLEQLAINSYLSIESIKCEYENGEEVLKFTIKTEEPNIVIGKYGETLFALQQIFRLMATKKFEEKEDLPHLIIDVDGYRESQIDNALSMAENSIRKMSEYGQNRVELPPMSSYKRRAIHFMVVEKYPEIQTESVGQGKDRKIVLSKKA
jgi:spoIIIJ-associated protein